jgi:hypothetical protein
MFAWMLLEAEGLAGVNVEVKLELSVGDGAFNCFMTSFITALVIFVIWSSERLLLASCLTTSTGEMKFY